MKVKTIKCKESAEAKLGRCGGCKKREGEVEKRVAVGIINCDSCMDMASWAITGRFHDRNAEQISQTAASAQVRHKEQGWGTTYNSCLIPNLIHKHSLALEKQ